MNTVTIMPEGPAFDELRAKAARIHADIIISRLTALPLPRAEKKKLLALLAERLAAQKI